MAAMAVTILSSCNSGGNGAGEVKAVKTDRVTVAGETARLNYPGKVKAAQDVNLAFRVSGVLEKYHVEEGQQVRSGQLLASLDPTDYQVQLDATEAEYRQIKADAERITALYSEDVATASDNDRAVYGLKQIEAKYKHHQDELSYTKLYAPFDGTVQKNLFEAHETVGAGTPVLSMVSGGQPEVEINIPAAEYVRRASFSDFSCTFEVYPGKSYALKLISISPKANSNQLYTMRLQVLKGDNPSPAPGMNTMVSISCVEQGETVQLSVPSGAVRNKDGRTSVFLVNASDNKVHAEDVSVIRLTSDGKAIITSEAISAGDVIVAAGANHLVEGETVRCMEAVTETNVGGLL